MTAGDLLTREVITIGRNESLLKAKELMALHGIRHLVVLEDAAGCAPTVVGVLSERDLFLAAMSGLIASGEKAQNAFLDAAVVKEAMSSKVVSTTSNTPVGDCARYLKEHHIGCLPVIDDGELKGVITVTDLLGLVA